MIDQTVDVVFLRNNAIPSVRSVRYNVLNDESSDLVAPVCHSRHVSVMKWHEEWQEIGCVALVHLEEYFVKVSHHMPETIVLQVEVFGTEIRDEDVRAGMKDQWFRVHVRV